MQNVEDIAGNLTFLDGYDNILTCGSFRREYSGLFKKDPSGKRDYQKWLNRQLDFLTKATNLDALARELDSFEKIKQCNEFSLFVIRRPHSRGNPRLLFSAIVDEDDRLFILLLAFKELNSSDYTRNIPVAETRMKEIIQSIKEGV